VKPEKFESWLKEP